MIEARGMGVRDVEAGFELVPGERRGRGRLRAAARCARRARASEVLEVLVRSGRRARVGAQAEGRAERG